MPAPVTVAQLENAARDLETIEAVSNSSSPTTQTRFGATIDTLQGAISKLHYIPPIAFTNGINVNSPLITVLEAGVVYAPLLSAIPFTTTASFNPAQWYTILPLVSSFVSTILDEVDAPAFRSAIGVNVASVLCATTANVTLSGEQTIDGQATSASRVLVKNQTAPAENGIYLTAAGAWSRVADMDAWADVPGMMVVVQKGTKWADTLWSCRADAGGTLGTTAITWRRIDNNVLRNTQTGTSYTVVADDHNQHITYANAAAVAVTHPQATGNFDAGFHSIHENLGPGTVTITPTTSTINGAASLTLLTGQTAFIDSDGTNLRALVFETPAVAKSGDINGLTLAVVTTTTFSVAPGYAVNEDSGQAFGMTLAASITKALTGFTAGTGNGSLDTGAAAANTWYHVHLIRKTSDGSIDVLLSLSATAPTMPSGYVARRRIGSIRLNGSTQITAFSQEGDEFLWDSAVVDVNQTNPGTTAVTPTLSVPSGVKVIAIFDGGCYNATNNYTSVNFSSPDVSNQTVQVPATSSLSNPISTGGSGNGAVSQWLVTPQRIRTNTSSQIRYRMSATAAADRVGIVTRGWIDRRGR